MNGLIVEYLELEYSQYSPELVKTSPKFKKIALSDLA